MKTVLCLLAFFTFTSCSPVDTKKSVKRLYVAKEEAAIHRNLLLWQKDNGEVIVENLNTSQVSLQASQSDATFYFYSRNNPSEPLVLKSDAESIEALAACSLFDPTKVNVFVTHGWNNDYESPVNTLIKDAVLGSYDVNLFIVDWGNIANCNYITAHNAVPAIGRAQGNFINRMLYKFNIKANRFYLIGHSLGAHIAGAAGSIVEGLVDLIIGLDPAKPLFSYGNINKRLDTTDARFVHVIHTCGNWLGFMSAIGHADYYPNGGSSQPGCGLDLTGSCAHSRSYQYFAESIRQNRFISRKCESFQHYVTGFCKKDHLPESLMGGWQVDTNASGDFYLKTNSEEPFAIGEYE